MSVFETQPPLLTTTSSPHPFNRMPPLDLKALLDFSAWRFEARRGVKAGLGISAPAPAVERIGAPRLRLEARSSDSVAPLLRWPDLVAVKGHSQRKDTFKFLACPHSHVKGSHSWLFPLPHFLHPIRHQVLSIPFPKYQPFIDFSLRPLLLQATHSLTSCLDCCNKFASNFALLWTSTILVGTTDGRTTKCQTLW